MHHSHPIHFAGTILILDSKGVIYWPDEKTLIVSDLHFEKGSFFAQDGLMLPPHDSKDTLERLCESIDTYTPDTVISLGDSFHDCNAVSRLDKALIEHINVLSQRLKWVWVLGNHDPHIPDVISGMRTEIVKYPNMILAHEPEQSNLPQIIGHFHPKMTHKHGKRKLRGKCFTVTDTMLIMPSFGSYTGGLDIHHRAITDALQGEIPQTYMIYRDKIWHIDATEL